MNLSTALNDLIARREVLIIGLLLAVLVLLWLGHRARKIARSERPDESLSNLVMLIGLGWSSEAVWEIARHRLGFPLGLTLLLFFIFESLLTLAMIRAKRHMREFGWPGRFGNTAWTIAACMALVAMVASHSIAEAVLRMVIPLLVVKQWWDGLVGGALKKPADASTWRWTPRRALLALGAIEPGERDVHTVHRERLTQQMTTLYHRINHGSNRLRSRRSARLARLSLTADDAIIAEVRRRGDRALWFTQTHPQQPLPTRAGTTTGGHALDQPATPVTLDEHAPAAAPSPASPAPAAPATADPARPVDIPTPDVVAERITAARPRPTRPAKTRPTADAPDRPAHTTDTKASKRARPADDIPVSEPDRAQLSLPLVPEDVLRKAEQTARQYQAENGTRITVGQLAARLKVNSNDAADLLAVLHAQHGPDRPEPAVNGHRPNTATR
ncbi:hypothetical protein ACTI_78280 [Actinoplanes sp. OR16]|uniref:hypothetical protein n=1 Tax=Actinoplanes sp. OR16 TaxID=946334 RepID=UPI000F717A90|nr:hypothetical protein [Actinoplanes sp. OR16]BBH71143.1 hypothetical protein ACTI_78280 [Actinoplanes sp. OR16]